MKVQQDDARAARVAERVLGVKFSHPMVGMVIRDDAGRGRGVVIFNNWNGTNIDMTGVGMGCWTPSVIRSLARYVFHQLGAARVTSHTRQSNGKAIRALRAMGFKPEGRAEDWFGNEHAVVYGLTARRQRIVH